MSLTSLSFIGVYFPLLLIAYYNPIIRGNTFRKIILIVASLGLYAFSEPVYIVLLLGTIVFNYCMVKLSDNTNFIGFRVTAIVVDVLILLTFKYINALLSFALINGSFSSIAFPIGLSYFIFKTISYVVDSFYKRQGNLVDVAIYISNFMTIVSGPLSTYEEEIPYIREKHNIRDVEYAYKSVERIIIGLGKKVIIADSLGVLVSQCFSSSNPSVMMAWAGAIAFTLQIFFDFSGYTDMVIGIGCLFGFNLPENFNYPYMASSITDFWKRWHISLTKWLKKYVYYPLGGSHVKTKRRHIFNLFIVWMVTGIWHGPKMTFIIWAMIFFVLQLIEKYTKWNNILEKVHLAHLYTLLVVIVEMIIFRASSTSFAVGYIKTMFFLNGSVVMNQTDISTILQYIIPFGLGVIFSINIGEKIKNNLSSNSVCNCVYNIGLIALFAVCIIIIIGRGYSAPLYADF